MFFRMPILMPALALVAGLLVSTNLWAARTNPYSYDNQNVAIREIRDGIDDLRHGLNNHETEIRVLEEKIKNQEIIFESIQDRVNESKINLKSNASNLDNKLNSLESTLKGIIADLRQFKSHANESSEQLTASMDKILELEKTIDQQNKNISHLQTAMQSLMDAFQIKDGSEKNSSSNSYQTYQVKNGDSLEKIARRNHTNVKTLKELNNLANDRIKIGQFLQLPGD